VRIRIDATSSPLTVHSRPKARPGVSRPSRCSLRISNDSMLLVVSLPLWYRRPLPMPGDQKAIAKETAQKLGLGKNILDANILEETEFHKKGRVEDQIEQADGFAEVFPEHKYHIVEVLQDRKHIVGMTGDGVNDAPALKKADCGIAVSGATDAARSASSIVLLSSGISVIKDALDESRRIFKRMKSYTIYRITETIRVLLFMTLSILVFNFYPVTAVMIVLLALLNDGAILTIAYDNAKPSQKPDRWNMHQVFTIAMVLGGVGVVESFLLFYLGDQVYHLENDFLQTLIYLKLSVAGHLTVFVARTKGFFWTDKPSWQLLLAVVVTQLIATIISAEGILMAPIGWVNALLIWAYCLVWFFIEDLMKVNVYKLIEDKKKYNWRKLV
ncbi:MAG TPA: HAD-IC family P-type ATPase, partial [Bacteroidales bacterium]|nr:HAD-IC family P-type ATPase [Bacteroidales bacterium]